MDPASDYGAVAHGGPSGRAAVPSSASAKLWLLVCVACLGGVQFGYNTAVVSPAKLMIDGDFPSMTDSLWSVVVSACLGASIVGAIAAGPIMNTYGRLNATAGSALLNGAGMLVMGFAPKDTWLAFALGRVLCGLGIGVSSASVSVYIAEAVPAHMRGTCTVLNTVCLTGAQVCATALGVPFSHTAHGWRYLFMLGAVPSILQFVGCFWIVESPQWLVSKGRVEDAKAALADLRSGDSDVDTELELLQKETTVQSDPDHSGAAESLFQDPGVYRALVLACMLQISQQLSGANAVVYFSATIILRAAVTSSPALVIWLSTLIAACNFVFTLAAALLVERVGRRPLWVFSHAGVTFMLTAVAFSFYAGWSTLGVLGLGSLLAFYALGMGCLPWTIAAEIFPVEIRGTCNAITTTCNWSSNLLCTLTFLPLIHAAAPADDPLNPWPVFAMYASVNAAGMLYIGATLPETKSLPSDTIRAMFNTGWLQFGSRRTAQYEPL